MRFMMLMIPNSYDGMTPDLVDNMMKYNDALVKSGALLSADGLHPLTTGARVSFAGGKPTITDGPFTEAKEVLGGYWLIEVKSKEEAVEWASRVPALDGDIVEVRQVQAPEDFPPEIQAVVSKYIG